jgi:hypothetical protein
MNHKGGIISLMFLALALIFGSSYAMAVGTTDDQGLDTQFKDSTASGSKITEFDLAFDEIDDHIAKFRPYQFPLETDFRKDTQQRKVMGYEIDHYSSGQEILEGVTNAAITNAGMASSVVLPTIAASKVMFTKDNTIAVPDVDGYAADGTTVNGCLMLIVIDKTTAGVVTVEALNGPLNAGDMYVPAIADASSLIVCANACAESQMVVAPENYQPRPSTVYLQKKIVNVVITDFFKEIIKKIPLMETDIREDALYKFRRKNARSLWIGAKSKRKVNQGTTMGDEYVYTSDGVLRQVDRLYGIADVVEYQDLIGISKMQFTTNSANNEANVYCGKNFIEKLLNIDFEKHKDVEFTAKTVLGVDIKAFKSTFGTLNFKYDPTLDDIGYSEFAVVVDIKSAVRYVKVDEKNTKVDMKEGAGDVREATRDITTQIDCLALRGYNSILVGQSDTLVARYTPNITINVTTVATLPATPSDGDIVYLSAADAPWPAGSLIIYNGTTTDWEEYHGVIEA